jgi:predicted enzyme related to lactoylglutathione lyase
MPEATLQPVILSADLERLMTFYTTLFNATPVARVPREGPALYVGLQIGSSMLGLVADAEAASEGASRILLSVDVDNIDDLLEQVDDAGGSVLGPPSDMPWGQRVAHLRDPDGNTVNLTQPINR